MKKKSNELKMRLNAGEKHLETRKSNPNKPVRVLGYGPEGVGKSTLGAKSDKPVFITPEGGTDQLTDSQGNPIEELPNITNWLALKAGVQQLISDKHDFKTLVLDSADWIEGLAHAHIIGASGKTIITVNGGYGAGYRASQNLHQELIKDLSVLREKRGMNIVITAHAHVKTVKDPEMTEDYDAFEIKCHEFVSALWREWVDGLFFIRFKTFVQATEDTAKARAYTDGTRVLYAEKRPSFQAKNRYGMPNEMEFKLDFWSEFMKFAKKGVQNVSPKELQADIEGMIKLVSDEATRKTVKDTVKKAGVDIAMLTAIKGRLKEITKSKEA